MIGSVLGMFGYEVPCEKIEDLHVVKVLVGDFDLHFSPEQYIQSVYSMDGKRHCLVAFSATSKYAKPRYLGTKLLGGYYNVFDYGNKQVGFVLSTQ